MAANIKERNVLAFLRSQPNHTSAKSKIAQHFGSANPSALNSLFQRLETNGQIRKLGRHSLVLKKDALSGFSTDESMANKENNLVTVSQFVQNCHEKMASLNKGDIKKLLTYVQSVAKEILQNKNELEQQFRDAVKTCLCEFDAQTNEYKGSDADCKEKCEEARQELEKSENTGRNELWLENEENKTKYFYLGIRKAIAEKEFKKALEVLKGDGHSRISTEALTSDETESQLSNSQTKSMFQKVVTKIVKKAKGTLDRLEKMMVPESPDSRLDFVMFIFYGLMSRLYLLNAADASYRNSFLHCVDPDGCTEEDEVWAFVTVAQIFQVISVIGSFLSLIAFFMPKKQ
mmetsp:Transcript_3274/g.4771  ORF Transcript_3274/g.4771 Transcript_3274/m.4771 type:complete len:346 (-) Transcript_3274:1242-2279(-)|eukprot:CAMPEP_0175150742 /NCGR_PEP_ID=MMETSP0087-20121206/18067_1 /TAXON_ID=136419 /ORGANISM="Unknown Unknown, Strain D1" /LENGTH=345 /DNA_ID=CAMNT_0016436777 /DNA_START=16 /DNA_END=1053 /DNA_ORIENTATION=+